MSADRSAPVPGHRINPRINGVLRYAIDQTVPGSWHLRLVRSTVPAGRVVKIDSSFVDDDVVVITPEDVAGYDRYGCQIEDQQILTSQPKFVGDPIVAVVAADDQAARAAAAMIEIDYTELPAVFDEMDAVRPGAPLVHATHATSDSDSAYFDMRPQDGTNVCHRFRIRTAALQGRDEPGLTDDPFDDAFAAAEVIVEDTFHVPAAAHVPMEPHATTAQWVGGRLEVTTGTQTPFNLRQDLAGLFGLADRAGPGDRPADGRRVRRQDLHAHRGDHRCGREAGRAAGALRAGPQRGLHRTHPARRHRADADRRHPGRTLRRQADVVLRQHRRLRRLRSRRRPEDGVRRGRAVPVRPRRGGLLLHLHQPAAGRRLPRIRRDAVGLGLRAADRRARRPARHGRRWNCAG